MALTSLGELVLQAQNENRAVGAFSVSSIEMMLGVLDAAQELNTPVILQVAEVRLPYAPLHIIGPAMIAAAKGASVPVGVHLDHGEHFETVCQAIDLGFTSVMIDGSKLPLEENIALTRRVVEVAHAKGVSVEAEIGVMGRTESGEIQAGAACADPDEALRFAGETQVDALAVAIGNSHGLYHGNPQLRYDILEKISTSCSTPLVLHGGTGISDDDFRRCISYGMRKVNIATATFMATAEAAQGAKGFFDMSGRMRKAAYEVAKHHITVFGVAKA